MKTGYEGLVLCTGDTVTAMISVLHPRNGDVNLEQLFLTYKTRANNGYINECNPLRLIL